ncbi:VOC family protein [Indiicoccus explosivorum]|uniref:VOC family protein n=1 Tax=Indiicoccus explosivorum TaxID=1917864 RepID=UPI000B441A87|nr:VOC family protein [Indiicoccus explosivorum]
MWKHIECVAVHTEDIEKSIQFYETVGLTKVWDTFQDAEQKWRLVGMRFPAGGAELVLKNNPDLKFAETEIMVEDVNELYTALKTNQEVTWIREPFSNALGGHAAVMRAPDGNVYVLVGN